MDEVEIRRVLARLSAAFEEAGVEFALIGALALAAHGAGRATEDVDFLVLGEQDDRVDRLLRESGYACLQRNENVGNYQSDDPALGRVDVLFARREHGKGMLQRASLHPDGDREVPVVDAADLIGLKVQAYHNDPSRRRKDQEDIVKLMRRAADLDMERVRLYFRIFDREQELEDLLEEGSG